MCEAAGILFRHLTSIQHQTPSQSHLEYNKRVSDSFYIKGKKIVDVELRFHLRVVEDQGIIV